MKKTGEVTIIRALLSEGSFGRIQQCLGCFFSHYLKGDRASGLELALKHCQIAFNAQSYCTIINHHFIRKTPIKKEQ